MVVKNIVVSNKGLFEETLILELIHHQIGYVQIEDEFHFLDYIYRFYDLQDLKKLKERINSEEVRSPLELFKPEDFMVLTNSVPEVAVSTSNSTKKYRKSQMRLDNQMTNQTMKRSRK